MIFLPDILLPKQKYFGLSIERTAIRAVELNSARMPVHSGEVLLPPGIFENGQLIKPDELSKYLSELVKQSKITTPYVSVTFPEVFAFTRGHSMPVMNIVDLNEAVHWQVKDLFPFSPDDLYFDWKIMDQTDKEIRITVVAVQKIFLDQLVSSFQKSGLKPLRFEPDATALSRLLTLNINEHALLVDVHPKGAYVTLVEGDKSLFTTVVQFADGESPQQYLVSIDNTLNEINSYYKDKEVLRSDNTYTVVTGDLASQTWVDHLKQVLGYDSRMLVTKVTNQKYNKAYAAAVSGIARPLDENSINVLPTFLQKHYDQQKSEQFTKSILKRIMFILILLNTVSLGTFSMSLFQYKKIESQLRLIESQTKSQPVAIEKLLQLNSLAKQITMLAPLRTTVREKIIVLVNLASDDIQFTTIEYDDRNLQFRVSGIAATREALLAFKDRLDKSKVFSKITLPLGSLELPVQVPFIITFVTK